MAKFILLYKGPATPMDQMTPEMMENIKKGWEAWIGQVGSALVEVGSPMGAGKSVVDDGSSGQVSEFTGYSIVEANDVDAALQLVNGHPFLSEGKGRFSVEVFELLPNPM